MVIALPQSGESTVERRRGFLRFEVHLDRLQAAVWVVGFEPTNGVLLNISRRGMKVCFKHEIPNVRFGYDCLVRFMEAGGRVSPEVMLGQLRWTEVVGEYAIEFNEPLEVSAIENLPSASQGEVVRFRDGRSS